MKAYLVDVGILLKPNEEEFEFYSCVYDHKYGYYDTNQYYVLTLEQAKKDVQEHINQTDNYAYGVISITELSDDFDFEDCHDIQEHYLINDIEYSICKINNEIKENFIIKGE